MYLSTEKLKMLTHSGYVVGDIYYGGSGENCSPLGIVYRLTLQTELLLMIKTEFTALFNPLSIFW